MLPARGAARAGAGVFRIPALHCPEEGTSMTCLRGLATIINFGLTVLSLPVVSRAQIIPTGSALGTVKDAQAAISDDNAACASSKRQGEPVSIQRAGGGSGRWRTRAATRHVHLAINVQADGGCLCPYAAGRL